MNTQTWTYREKTKTTYIYFPMNLKYRFTLAKTEVNV